MNDFDDLEELERELGPSLQLALRRAAGGITDERPRTAPRLSGTGTAAPATGWDDAATEAIALGDYPTQVQRPGHRRRLVLAAAAAALLLVAGGALVRVATDDSPDGVSPAGPNPAPTTSPAPPPSEQYVVPPEGAAPSSPETGALLSDLPAIPVFVYEDGRVIWPDSIPASEVSPQPGDGWDWFERRLTPVGLDLVRAETRSGGRLDPAAPPEDNPWSVYLDGERELPMGEYTHLEYPDLSWIPARAWEDPEPRPFVPSHYAVCLGWPDADLAARLSRLPAVVAEPFAGARQVPGAPSRWVEGTGFDSTCFDLAIDDARQVEAAIAAAGAGRLNLFAYVFAANEDPSMSVSVGFTPYLPHGNPVFWFWIP